MINNSFFIKKAEGQDLWIININRVKIGTIRLRRHESGDRYWVHMPSFKIGPSTYPEMNFYSKNLSGAIGIANGAWAAERGALKFDILKQSMEFEHEKVKSPFKKIQKSRISAPVRVERKRGNARGR